MKSVLCDLPVTGCAGEQSSACVIACTSFQEFWLFPWEECSLLTFATSEGIITNVCGFSSFEVGNIQTMVAHPGCSFRKKLLEFNVDENLMFQL